MYSCDWRWVGPRSILQPRSATTTEAVHEATRVCCFYRAHGHNIIRWLHLQAILNNRALVTSMTDGRAQKKKPPEEKIGKDTCSDLAALAGASVKRATESPPDAATRPPRNPPPPRPKP